MRVLLVSANRERYPSPVVPIGVLYVAAAIRGRHDVEVVDLCFEEDPDEALREAIARFRPDLVGLGLRNLHDNTYGSSDPLLAYYAGLAATIRAATAAPLVVGGAAVTLRPQALCDRLGAAHAVVGEGEVAFSRIVDAIARGETPPRIVHAAAARATVVELGRREKHAPAGVDLDELPRPARDLADPRYFEFDGTDSLQTKRGCAFECSYCDYPDLEGRKVRVRDPHAVADELVACTRTPGVSHVFVVDSVFNVPRSHALAVCDAIIERGAPLPWVAYVSPASFDETLARAMARAGCVGVEIGTDSGSDAMLARLNKPFSLAQVRRARSALRDAGIADCHTFVLGAEGESVAEAEETLRFVDELDPDVAVFVVFMEDRETHTIGRASEREAILELLARETPKRRGWVVPELGIRFGPKVARFVESRKLRGPAWLHLASPKSRQRSPTRTLR